ncbi:MAG: lysophospholipid acyltransferase family protein [Pirellulaceae bacterium]
MGSLRRWGGYGLALGLRRLLGTLDVRVTHYDRSVDPSLPEFRGLGIYVFWHEYITFPIACWGNYDIAMLVSQHRDADWLIHAAEALRFRVVRGSSTRGGSQAIRELKRISKEASLTITPDGPQGPRRQLAMGPIYLASRLGLPIIPVGFGYDRPWRFNTWDAFAVPRPFSRARGIMGDRVFIAPRLGRDALETARLDVERRLNRLTVEAEILGRPPWRSSGRELGFSRRRRRSDVNHLFHHFRWLIPNARPSRAIKLMRREPLGGK